MSLSQWGRGRGVLPVLPTPTPHILITPLTTAVQSTINFALLQKMNSYRIVYKYIQPKYTYIYKNLIKQRKLGRFCHVD